MRWVPGQREWHSLAGSNRKVGARLEVLASELDIGRETVALIRQNWNIISIPNTIALGLACIGLLGPIGATLLSNGSAIVATMNGLRPIMEQQPIKVVSQARADTKLLPSPMVEQVTLAG